VDKVDDFALAWLRDCYASENARKDAIFETVSVPMSGLTTLGAVQAFWIAGFTALAPKWQALGKTYLLDGGPAILKGFANAMTIYGPVWVEVTLGIVFAISPILLGVWFLVLSSRKLMKVASGNKYALAAPPQAFGEFVEQTKEAGKMKNIPKNEILMEVKRYLMDDLTRATNFNIEASETRLIHRKECFEWMMRSAVATLVGLAFLALAVFGTT